MKNKPLLQRAYHIPLDMYDEAFLYFQRKHVYPRNLIITAVLLAISGVYIHAAVKDPENTLTYLLIVVCLAMILVTWYKTFKLRRAVHTALKDVENDTYELTAYEEKLVIRTEDAPKQPEEQENQQEPEEQSPAEESNGGFNQLFPETEKTPAESIPPTEIPLDGNLRFYELERFFMVYIVKQNFYVIPKKDFSEDEVNALRKLFKL